MGFKAVRVPWAQRGQYLHGWAESLQIVSEPIPDLDVGSVTFGPTILDSFVTSHIRYGRNFMVGWVVTNGIRADPEPRCSVRYVWSRNPGRVCHIPHQIREKLHGTI